MRILFLSTVHTVDDKRVFHKEAITLVDAGYHVSHLAPGTSDEERVSAGVRLVQYADPGAPFRRLRRSLRLLLRARREEADVYHCNEPDSWVVGILLSRFRASRVVFDAHEHYSTRIETRFRSQGLRRRFAQLVRWIFSVLARRTDRIVLAKASLEDDFAGSREKTVMVRNFVKVSDDPGVRAPRAGSAGVLRALHLGQMSRIRGWPQLLDALRLTRCTSVSAMFVGVFTDGSEAVCRERAAELGIADRLRVLPWVPMGRAIEIAAAADVGLLLLQPGIYNHVVAFPHKMFDYMLAGIPVIAPRFAVEVAAIVRDAGCGILLDTADPAAIAAALDLLAADVALRERMGQSGRQAVFERLNWESESVALTSMYRDLAEEHIEE
jgi:glycosyltransferase involved in cell wall biosynthesis